MNSEARRRRDIPAATHPTKVWSLTRGEKKEAHGRQIERKPA